MESATHNYYPLLRTIENDRTVYEWWEELQDDKGGRANLRRCSSPVEATFQPAYHRLISELRRQGAVTALKDDPKLTIAAMAGLLAHIRTNTGVVPRRENTPENEKEANSPDSEPTGRGSRTFGQTLSGDAEVLSELRFRRLLQTDDQDTLYRTMIRVIRQCNYSVPLLSFAATIVFWEEDRTRQQLAFGYYDTPRKDA